jgi:hypothetical protein
MTLGKLIRFVCCGLAMALCLSKASLASQSGCQDAVSEYNSAISDISATLRRYTSCVSK